MSQTPVLPEENTEEIKTAKPRRSRKSAAEAPAPEAEAVKPVRRTRKAAKAEAEAPVVEQAAETPAEAAEPVKKRRTRKAEPKAEAEAPVMEQAAEPAKKRRTRKTAKPVPADIAAAVEAAPGEEVVRLGSALVLDDMLPPASFTAAPAEAEEEAPAEPAKKRRTRKTEPKAEAPKRTRRTAKAEEPAAPETHDDSDEKDDSIIHLGSAIVLDDMLPPAGVTADAKDDDSGEKERRQDRRKEKRVPRKAAVAEPGNKAADKAAPAEDNIGNRAEPKKEAKDVQPEWFDDGVVTNILPYPGEFSDDIRSHRRGRRNRRNRDAQPDFNGSPYLPAPYQQPFFPAQQMAQPEPFGNRKNRNKKNRRDKGVPTLPADFDFNSAMLNDSVLGAAFSRQEEDLPEDDGPQPFVSDQPSAQSFASVDMAEEDLEALDAAVNGNRIDGPAVQQPKENRKERKGKKAKEEKPARESKKAKAAEPAEAAEPKAAKTRRLLYISVVPDEQVEVVITEDGQVTEYFVEMAHQVKIRGNIYKGVINNIDTNLQAAFVNFGNGKNGFLQIDEVHPEYYLVPHVAPHGPKYPPIQKVLKVGQEVLVQVVKEPAGTKGAFLTTWISIAGRFLVLTPGQEQIGVSRKVEDNEERARLKDLLNGIQPGENMGVIIRTASEGASKTSIQQDLQYLKKLWKDIQKKAPAEKSPSLIYQEADLAARSLRDYLSDDIDEIWTDDETAKTRAEEMVGLLFPERTGIVKLHKEQRQTMWERFGLLKQLESVTSREVVLPSGGRLVFDQTEALMAIDINSGKTQGKTNFEAMVYRTNMEAAEAIARHLRLRDIGGQVVIDFIEMRDKSHCRDVERTLRNAMRKDRARHDVGHMSSFGLLELVRQRTGTSAISITSEPCPHCHGTGVRRNMEWQSLQALRDLQSKLCKSLDSGKKKVEQKAGEPATFTYESDAELALYLLNRKRDRIAALEEKFGVHIEIRLKQ